MFQPKKLFTGSKWKSKQGGNMFQPKNQCSCCRQQWTNHLFVVVANCCYSQRLTKAASRLTWIDWWKELQTLREFSWNKLSSFGHRPLFHWLMPHGFWFAWPVLLLKCDLHCSTWYEKRHFVVKKCRKSDWMEGIITFNVLPQMICIFASSKFQLLQINIRPSLDLSWH